MSHTMPTPLLPVTQPRAAQTLEEEAAFRAFGFDPSEPQMPAVIAVWVSDYRKMQAGLINILPSVDPNQQAAATGVTSTLTFRENAQAIANENPGTITGTLASVGVKLADAKDKILELAPQFPSVKKVLIGLAIGVGVIVIIFGLRSTTGFIKAVKE